MSSLSNLIESRRVILCVGCGGVGKTTVSAALGLSAAVRGKRALCLTIDPARRLAESLGLVAMTTDAQRVSPDRFSQAGLSAAGSLTVMMLDTKRTFDELIVRHASSPEVCRRILENRLYQHISSALAGTQAYMAMEKLYEIRNDPQWDIIVLDTPPTTHALDFLDAPDRMIEALDSAVLRWLMSAFSASSKAGIHVLARSAATVLRGLGRVTGHGFLEAAAEFLVLINEQFGGFRNRAREVQSTLRGSDVAYVLVTSPDPMSLREIGFLARQLETLGMPRDALVVNRVHPRLAEGPTTTEDAVLNELGSLGVALEDGAGRRVRVALADARRRGILDAGHLSMLDPSPEIRAIGRVDVPALVGDLSDLKSLGRLARSLGAL